MKITLLASLFLLASCGVKKIVHKKLNIHPDAASYVATFEEKGNIKIDDLEVGFQALPESQSNILGYCQKAPRTVQKPTIHGVEEHIYKTPRIVLNTKYWNGQGFQTANKEELVYHELGHCIYGLGHENSTNSIMNPYHLGANHYIAHYGTLMLSLFKRSATVIAAYTNMAFDPNEYASSYNEPTASTYEEIPQKEEFTDRFPAFQPFDVPELNEHNLKDCVDEKELEVIQEAPETEVE